MVPLDVLSETLKLLSDKTRLTILALLKEKEMCVCDIVEILNDPAECQPALEEAEDRRSGG